MTYYFQVTTKGKRTRISLPHEYSDTPKHVILEPENTLLQKK